MRLAKTCLQLLGILALPSLDSCQLGFRRDEFAAESFGEDGLRQFVGSGRGGGDAAFDVVGQLEQGIDAADDFVLLGEGRNGQKSGFKKRSVESWPSNTANIPHDLSNDSWIAV